MELIKAAIAAVHALRSYQYGNASTELAEEIADALEAAVTQALDTRDKDLATLAKGVNELETLVQEIKTNAEAHMALSRKDPRPVQ